METPIEYVHLNKDAWEEDRIARLEERQEARAWRERLYDLEGE